jgi:hypothetical protein
MNSPSKYQPWTDVAVFEDLDTGKAVETLLTNQGLHARTYDDKLTRCFLFLRPPRVTFRLQVRESDFNRAQDFLRARARDGLPDAIHCPDCGSLRLSYPQMTRKFILPTIVLHVGILLRVLEHQCYCEDCHCMWSLPDKTQSPAAKAAPQSA